MSALTLEGREVDREGTAAGGRTAPASPRDNVIGADLSVDRDLAQELAVFVECAANTVVRILEFFWVKNSSSAINSSAISSVLWSRNAVRIT